MAMALVHGGSAVHLLSPSVFNYLSGLKPCNIIVGIEEVPDDHIRMVLEKVKSVIIILYYLVLKLLGS